MPGRDDNSQSGPSRRRFLGVLGAGIAGAAVVASILPFGRRTIRPKAAKRVPRPGVSNPGRIPNRPCAVVGTDISQFTGAVWLPDFWPILAAAELALQLVLGKGPPWDGRGGSWWGFGGCSWRRQRIHLRCRQRHPAALPGDTLATVAAARLSVLNHHCSTATAIQQFTEQHAYPGFGRLGLAGSPLANPATRDPRRAIRKP